jgi:hypothetical protein
MKIAVLSESTADEAAVLPLVRGLLGTSVEAVAPLSRRPGGWQAALRAIGPTLTYLHYRSDADGFVVIVDSDDSPVHRQEHDQPDSAVETCRLCTMRAAVEQVQRNLRSRQGRGPLKIALGLAVPAIEAWYLTGLDSHVTESAWIAGQQSHRPPFTRLLLKAKVYGTDRPSLAIEQECAVRHAERILRESKLPLLKDHFPNGFGALARDLGRW